MSTLVLGGDSKSKQVPTRPIIEPKCKRVSCGSNQIIIDNGEYVCRACGLVRGRTFDFDNAITQVGGDSNSYKRRFYFNERCTRWTLAEPKIHPEIWELVRKEASNAERYPDIRTKCNRATISKILRNVNITPQMAERFKSRKFKRQQLTKKRFYDKYFEKWKTIRWKLTGVPPVVPSFALVNQIKALFKACQEPFEKFRHHHKCDGRVRCEKYFKCWHNFVNYDYTFRIFLQICERDHGFKGAYELFKEEFILASPKIIKKKLRPMMTKFCEYNGWVMPPLD